MGNVIVMDHPLIQHKISLIRNKKTGTRDFRTIISEIAMLECYESTRDLLLEDVEIETPICATTSIRRFPPRGSCIAGVTWAMPRRAGALTWAWTAV